MAAMSARAESGAQGRLPSPCAADALPVLMQRLVRAVQAEFVARLEAVEADAASNALPAFHHPGGSGVGDDNGADHVAPVRGAKFFWDHWTRPDAEEGGGTSCVLQNGVVFEKAAVNVSVVRGRLPPVAVQHMRDAQPSSKGAAAAHARETGFHAAGVSVIAHPRNPHAPTVHMNLRFMLTTAASSGSEPEGSKGSTEDETANTWWFGGGADLTPYYVYNEDARAFHGALRDACDLLSPDAYPKYKKWCDEYFVQAHRKNEARGIGGIFFDDLRPETCPGGERKSSIQILEFVRKVGDSTSNVYANIVRRTCVMPYGSAQRHWQLLRRGRYAEFNLIHDRGTRFGLSTPSARIESILASLPPAVRWNYHTSEQDPAPESPEAYTMQVVTGAPREWLG